MIMLGDFENESPYSKLVKHPDEIDGYSTQSVYIVVKDIDAHYEQAKKHGAKIALELEEQDYGGKNYACYDPEGYLWNFGSYDPWNETG